MGNLSHLEEYAFRRHLYGVYKDIRGGQIFFLAKDSIPDSTVQVHLRASTSGVPDGLDSIAVVPPPDSTLITLCPPIASPGDTVSIIVHRKRAKDCQIFAYPDSQRFYVDFNDWSTDGVFGKFLDPESNTLQDYLWCTPQGFKFVLAADTVPDNPNHEIKFYVQPLLPDWCSSPSGAAQPQLVMQKGKNGAMTAEAKTVGLLPFPAVKETKKQMIERMRAERLAKLREKKAKHFATIADDPQVCYVDQGLKDQIVSILLGETKYFRALRCDHGPLGKHLVIDFTDNDGHSTDLGGGESSNVWGNDPIKVDLLIGKPTSDKLGVYWETEKPKPDGTGQLALGLIRVVGRYWREDSIYRVKLTAHLSGYEDAHAIIIVKKPTKLGDNYGMLGDGITPRISVEDVFGNDYNLDELIIVASGKFGVSPQFLKGQIQQESNFNPGYRWEPFVDAEDFRDPDTKYLTEFRYQVHSNGPVGDPGIPTTHVNVTPLAYFNQDDENPRPTIWDLLYVHSSTLNPNVHGVDNQYPRSNSKGKLLWREDASEEFSTAFWNTILNLSNSGTIDISDAMTMAYDSAKNYLRFTFRDGVLDLSTAQTRTASSYGVLQLTYYDAVDKRHYMVDPAHLPEEINIVDTNLVYALTHLISNLGSEHNYQLDIDENNWRAGWDSTFSLALNRYNGKDGKFKSYRFNWPYGPTIIHKFSIQYPPKLDVGGGIQQMIETKQQDSFMGNNSFTPENQKGQKLILKLTNPTKYTKKLTTQGKN